jgi:hypothetical protein
MPLGAIKLSFPDPREPHLLHSRDNHEDERLPQAEEERSTHHTNLPEEATRHCTRLLNRSVYTKQSVLQTLSQTALHNLLSSIPVTNNKSPSSARPYGM